MKARRALFVSLATALILTAIAIAIFAPRRAPHADVTFGTPVLPSKRAPDFVLIDGAGRPAHVVDSNYPVTMLFFGYAHCPDACPLALAALGRAYRSLDTARRTHVRIVFVTVDPVRDRPAALRAYVRNFDPHIVALTGSTNELAHVWDAYGVRIDARTREIGHGDTIYAIVGNARVAYIYPPDTPAQNLAADLSALTR